MIEDIPPFIGAGDFTYRALPVPAFVGAAESRLIDSRGAEYVDAEAANGSALLGYDPSLLQQALERATRLPALPSFCESPLRLEVAACINDRLTEATGNPGRVAFEVGGAQGIELALKIVAANRGTGQVLTFQGAYHGRSPFAAQLSASYRYRSLMGAAVGEVVRLPYPEFDENESGIDAETYLRVVMALIEKMGDEVSGISRSNVTAMILEPLLNVGGMVLPSTELLLRAAEHFTSAGALLVVDEIFTGFFRTGTEFGFQRHGLKPDVVVLSKGLTNGIGPLSAVWAREPLLDPERFLPGTHSSTFSATPLMLELARLSLSRIYDWPERSHILVNLESRLSTVIANLVTEFPSLIKSGYALGGTARLRLKTPIAHLIRRTALDVARDKPVNGAVGTLVASTGMAPDVVALHPPLTIQELDLNAVETLLRMALRTAEKSTDA